MCDICGKINLGGDSVEEALFRRMNESLIHH